MNHHKKTKVRTHNNIFFWFVTLIIVVVECVKNYYLRTIMTQFKLQFVIITRSILFQSQRDKPTTSSLVNNNNNHCKYQHLPFFWRYLFVLWLCSAPNDFLPLKLLLSEICSTVDRPKGLSTWSLIRIGYHKVSIYIFSLT